MFSSVFNKPVTVNKIDTILNGNDKCVFEVVYDKSGAGKFGATLEEILYGGEYGVNEELLKESG